jgi:hypothetical protein
MCLRRGSQDANASGAKGLARDAPGYFKHNGNLHKMQTDWRLFSERALKWLFWTTAPPLGAIYAAFHFGYEGTGNILGRVDGLG